MTTQYPVEKFPALDATGVCRSAFIERIPGIDVTRDKAETLRRLESTHLEIRNWLGLAELPLLTAEQIHSNQIAVVDRPIETDRQFEGVDGLITNQRNTVLGIHVADCCAVFIVDPVRRAIGLVHSGRKGTELEIAGKAIDQMAGRFGSKAEDLIVELSPSIRPPHYEVDFVSDIIAQCHVRGVKNVHDNGACTACDLTRYYSYRAEKGRTGRMLALLGLK